MRLLFILIEGGDYGKLQKLQTIVLSCFFKLVCKTVCFLCLYNYTFTRCKGAELSEVLCLRKITS